MIIKKIRGIIFSLEWIIARRKNVIWLLFFILFLLIYIWKMDQIVYSLRFIEKQQELWIQTQALVKAQEARANKQGQDIQEALRAYAIKDMARQNQIETFMGKILRRCPERKK